MRHRTIFFVLPALVLLVAHVAFAALETVTPAPQDNTNMSLSRSVDLSAPDAGVTDASAQADQAAAQDLSNPSGSNASTTAPPPGQDDPCYDLTVTEVNGTDQKNYTPQSGQSAADCEKDWKASNDNKQTFCKTYDFAAGLVSYVDSSGKTISLGDRCKQLGNGGDASAGAIAAQALAESAVSDIQPGTPEGDQQLTQALQNLGVSQTDAQAAVANNPDQVKSLLQDVATGNQTAAQQDAQSLGLNSDLFNSTSLQPSNLPNVLNGVASQDQLTNMNQALNTPDAPSTFDQSGGDQTQSAGQSESWNNLPVECGTSGIAGNLARSESACGQASGTYTRCGGSGACGVEQFLPGTYQTYLNYYTQNSGDTSCVGTDATNNACSVAITNYWYDNKVAPTCQSAVDAQGAGGGLTMTSCAYLYHFVGGGDFNNVINALPTLNQSAPASSLCGSLIQSSSCSSNPGFFSSQGQSFSIAGMFQNMDNLMSGNGSVIPSLASGPGTTISPLSAATGLGTLAGNDSSAVVYAGSPLSAAGLLSANNTGNNSLNSLLPLLMLKSLLGNTTQSSPPPPPPAPVQTAATTPTTGTTQTTNTTQPSNVTPTASISAQPAIVVPGNPIQLSWSSAGVTTNPACQVTENGTLLLQTDNGSDNIPTSSVTPVGKKTFTITCTATSGGQSLQQSASVIVN